MRKSILFLLASVVLSVTVGSAFTTPPTQKGGGNQQQSAEEREAAEIYNNLSSLPMSERKDFFRSSTPEVKVGLWKAHLRSYLSSHPELTGGQKEVIQSAIALLTPELFEIPQTSPDWQAKVDVPLKRLSRRVLEVFSREAGREILTRLGGPEPKAKPEFFQNISMLKTASASRQGYCSCSRTSDWCPQDHECIRDSCIPQCCCGTFLLYECNGRCYLCVCA